MKKPALRTSTTILGQRIDSPRFDKRSEVRDWVKTMRDTRKALRKGEEITAQQRRLLEQASFKFEILEGDIFTEDLAARFLVHRAKNYVASTASFNLNHVRKYILHHLARRNIYGIKPSEIRRMIEGLTIRKLVGFETDGWGVPDKTRPIYEDTGQKAGPSLKKAVLATLSQMFEYAKEEELVSEKFQNPAKYARTRGSRKAKAQVSRPFWKHKDDAIRWLNQASEMHPIMYDFGVLGLEAGLRKAEILALQWGDVDSRQGTITVRRQLEQVSGSVVERTKSGEAVTRTVPITKGIRSVLDNRRKRSVFTAPADFILSGDDGSPLSPRTVWQWFRDLCKEAKVQDITPHGTRHTFATHFILAGGRIEDLQKLMGHSSIQTTMVYLHLVEDMMRATRPIVSFTDGDGK